MATGPSTITGLPNAATLTGSENLPMDQGGSGLAVHATVNTVVAGGFASAFPTAVSSATATTALTGAELLPVDQSATLKKTTINQLITQLTAAGNPLAADLFFTNQSGNARSYTLSQLAAFSNIYTGAGTANAQTITLSPAPTAYYTGMAVVWLPVAANTAATTLNANGLGAKNVFAVGAALTGNELQIGSPAIAVYDGTQFNLINPFYTNELTIFTSNGNFVPKTTGSYYIMAIGGGGGGGGGGGASTTVGGTGGSGGSGGVLGFSTQSLTAGSTYAVVIGAGGTAGTAGTAGANPGGGGGSGGATTFNAVTIAAGGAGGGGNRGASSGSTGGLVGGNGCGNGGGQGGASVPAGNTPGNAGTNAAANTGGGGGGGSGGATAGTVEAGGAGGTGGTGILVIRKA